MEWLVVFTEKYEAWFQELPAKDKAAIATDLEVLRSLGPMLGRPYVDHIKSSAFPNLKELRTGFAGHSYRTLFAFDPERKAILLIGGDKKGKNQQKFYQQLIAQADAIFLEYLKKDK